MERWTPSQRVHEWMFVTSQLNIGCQCLGTSINMWDSREWWYYFPLISVGGLVRTQKKPSVAKHSSIPQSPETIIITLWPVNKGSSSKLLGEMVSGLGGWCLGCGADIHSHPHLRWIREQQKDGLRLGASHSFGSHRSRRVNKAYHTTIRLIQTGRNAHLNWGVSRPQTE